MKTILHLFQLPLLAKELVEQAARRRTYLLRVIYAGLLYVCLLGPELRFFHGNSNPLNVLGRGKDLWDQLLGLQLAGIALFLPALMAGRITQEKERDSLTLLLLTDLSPTQIVLQKYLAGLIPMLTFLLLGLPLAGVAYSFGGFGAREVWVGAMVIGFSCLQVGALSLWCSALFRNTVGAFLGTYFIGLVFYGAPGLLYEILREAGIRWNTLRDF
ncbi:MAG: ABC transporter permease, partial [Chthoniobacteraceae bacterium]